MSRRIPLPSPDAVEQAKTDILAEAHTAGRRPSVLALARHLGLTNATFWRYFPDTARDVAEHRRSAAPPPAGNNTDHDTPLRQQIANLRRTNHALTEHLDLAVANIQRLTLDNHQLRQELEAATNVTQLHPRTTRTPFRSATPDPPTSSSSGNGRVPTCGSDDGRPPDEATHNDEVPAQD